VESWAGASSKGLKILDRKVTPWRHALDDKVNAIADVSGRNSRDRVRPALFTIGQSIMMIMYHAGMPHARNPCMIDPLMSVEEIENLATSALIAIAVRTPDGVLRLRAIWETIHETGLYWEEGEEVPGRVLH
jgi:hypothetical protein